MGVIIKYVFNVTESDGKLIDAQVDQMTNVIMRMSGDILYKNRDEIVKRYIYSDKNLKIGTILNTKIYTAIYGKKNNACET